MKQAATLAGVAIAALFLLGQTTLYRAANVYVSDLSSTLEAAVAGNLIASRVHGVRGAYGNEQTLEYLYSLKDVPMHVAGPTYYFGDTNATGDFPASADTNDCLTPATACTSWWKLKEICRHANCILDAGDAQWMTVDVCTDVASGTSVPQSGGAADDICDEDGVTPTGVTSPAALKPDFDANSNIGSGDGRPWINIRSSRPGVPIVIDETTAATLAVFHLHGGGTAITQDLRFSAMTTDVYIAEDDTTHIINNMTCTGTVGSSDRCFRLAGGYVIALNSGGDAADSAIILVSENGIATWISTKALKKTSRDDSNPTVQMLSGGGGESPTKLTMIGATITQVGNAASQPPLIKTQTTPGYPNTLRLARVHMNAGVDPTTEPAGAPGNCIAFENDTDEYTDLEVYQSTFGHCAIGLQITSTAHESNENLRVIAKYNVFQTDTYSSYGVWQNLGGTLYDGTISIRDNVVNEQGNSQSAFFSIRDDAATHHTDDGVENMRALIDAGATDPVARMQTTLADFFVNDITVTDNDQFDGSCVRTFGTANGRGACICDVATPEDCATAIPSTYTIELVAPIPGEIFGTASDVQYLVLGDVNTNYGAY